MKISFLGATRMVTGSCFLLETETAKFLIDCGMFQGSKEINRLNYEPFAFRPEDIKFVILSHAHIDHSGRIPKLIKEGFKGEIYCTKATADLCSIMLPDSGHIHELENEWDNRKRSRSGEELREPLYTVQEAEDSLKYFKPILYNQKIEIIPGISLRLRDAGHILGSAIVELWIKEGDVETKLVFSGDLGRRDRPILRDPYLIEEADFVIIESTYGDRLHPPSQDDTKKLISIINETFQKKGNVIIPSFAIERAQDIIYELNKYYTEYIEEKNKEFLKVPVYIDSPLTVSATEIFLQNPDCFDEETLQLIREGNNPLDFPNLNFTRSTEESKELNFSKESKVIISASGMCTAGRIKHHLKHNLWRRESSIVFVGYQAEGTLGRKIKEGEKLVKIFGEEIKVNAEVYSLEGFSGHADQEGLIWWLKGFKNRPHKIFIVHGEEKATQEICKMIENELKIKTHIPELNEVFTLVGADVLASSVKAEKLGLKEKGEWKENVRLLKSAFWDLLQKLEEETSREKDNEKLNKLQNKLIEIQKNILELNMLLMGRVDK
ncbi:MAG: MBL fold metallo-hydrolase [Candidatus Caldatribacteriota bacterium]